MGSLARPIVTDCQNTEANQLVVEWEPNLAECEIEAVQFGK